MQVREQQGIPHVGPNTWKRQVLAHRIPDGALTDKGLIEATLLTFPPELRDALHREDAVLTHLNPFNGGYHGGKITIGAIFSNGEAIIAKYAADPNDLRRERIGFQWARMMPGVRRRTVRTDLQANEHVIVSRWFFHEGTLRDLVINGEIPEHVAIKIRRRQLEMNMKAWDGKGRRRRKARALLQNEGRYSMQHKELHETEERAAVKARQLSAILSNRGTSEVTMDMVMNADISFQSENGKEFFHIPSLNELIHSLHGIPEVEDQALRALGNLDLASKNILVQFLRIFGMPFWRWRDIDWEMVGDINKGEALGVGIKFLVMSEAMLPTQKQLLYEQGRIVLRTDEQLHIPERIIRIEEDGWNQIVDYARKRKTPQLLKVAAECLYWNYIHAAVYSREDPEVALYSLKRAIEWKRKADSLEHITEVPRRDRLTEEFAYPYIS